MPVVFDRSVIHDNHLPQTVEGSFRAYGNWSGLHDYHFDTLTDIPSQELTATEDWDDEYIFPDPVPTDVEITYTVDGKGHGVILRRVDSNNYLRVGLTEADHAEVTEFVGGVGTLLFDQLITLPTQGKVQVAYRQQRYSEDDTDQWESVSVWMNHKLLFTWTQPKVLADEYAAGITAEASTRTFTGIRIPQLTEFAEWSSLDPGEFPAGGLQRAIEGRYVRFYIRWNGALRAWRASAGSPEFEVDIEDIYTQTLRKDQRQIASHVRMLGAYIQSDSVRNDLMRKFGYRFIEVNNPYIMSVQAAQREAGRELQRLEEKHTNKNIVTEFCPLLEPEDHIEIDGEDYIIEQISWSVTGTSNVEQELSCRKYVLGS